MLSLASEKDSARVETSDLYPPPPPLKLTSENATRHTCVKEMSTKNKLFQGLSGRQDTTLVNIGNFTVVP